MINVGSTSTGGRVVAVDGNVAKLNLTYPVCCNVDEKVSLSRRIEGNFRYVAFMLSSCHVIILTLIPRMLQCYPCPSDEKSR